MNRLINSTTTLGLPASWKPVGNSFYFPWEPPDCTSPLKRFAKNPHLRIPSTITHDAVSDFISLQKSQVDQELPHACPKPFKHKLLIASMQDNLVKYMRFLGVREPYDPTQIEIKRVPGLDHAGGAVPLTQQILYRSDLADADVFKVLQHEYIHCAGNQVLMPLRILKNGAAQIGIVCAGLRFVYSGRANSHRLCFSGLDEAITEFLSIPFGARTETQIVEEAHGANNRPSGIQFDRVISYPVHVLMLAGLLNGIADQGLFERESFWPRAMRCYFTGDKWLFDHLLIYLGVSGLVSLSAVGEEEEDAHAYIQQEPKLSHLSEILSSPSAIQKYVIDNLIPILTYMADIPKPSTPPSATVKFIPC